MSPIHIYIFGRQIQRVYSHSEVVLKVISRRLFVTLLWDFDHSLYAECFGVQKALCVRSYMMVKMNECLGF